MEELEWPTPSPDFNLTEIFWAKVKKKKLLQMLLGEKAKIITINSTNPSYILLSIVCRHLAITSTV